MRYTPEIISTLKKNEVFVFGSNEAGIHGAGAAHAAFKFFGAVWGQGFGFQGSTFAIPTKNWKIETLDLHDIAFYVSRFIEFAKGQPKMTFYVTKIGCGLAGLEVKDVALFFYNAYKVKNIVLPKEFCDEIEAFIERTSLG